MRLSARNALLLLSNRRANMAEGKRHAHASVLYASEDETNAALHKAIMRVEKRSARDTALKGKSL